MPTPFRDGDTDDAFSAYGEFTDFVEMRGSTQYREDIRTSYLGECRICGDIITTKGARLCVLCRNSPVARAAREVVRRARRNRMIHEFWTQGEK
jgi:hypothetical protein